LDGEISIKFFTGDEVDDLGIPLSIHRHGKGGRDA